MSDLQSLPWRDAKSAPPSPNVRVLVVNDSNEIGLGCRTTGADWHTDHCGSIITHWLPLEAIPRPAPASPSPLGGERAVRGDLQIKITTRIDPDAPAAPMACVLKS